MMKEIVEWQWKFGGLIEPIAGIGAWIVLAGALLFSAGFAWWSYGRSLRALSAGRRFALVGLRALVILFILLCLANPVRVERRVLENDDARRIAVVADRSDSMTAPDGDGRSRLEDAADKWRAVERRAEDFATPDPYAFDRSLVPVSKFEDAVRAGTGEGGETRLFAALGQLLAEAGDGSTEAIVCLTDGLDTTGESPDSLIAAAQAAQVPLYFVVGRNRLQREESLRIRNLAAPTTTLPNSQIAVRAVIEANSDTPRRVPVRLVRDGLEVSRTELELPRGDSLKLWEATVTTGAPGPMRIELRVGEPAERISKSVTTNVAGQLTTRVLFFQGALDWGYRFFRDALSEDENFEVTALFSPDVGVRLQSGSASGLTNLPDSVAELSRFNLVVLSNVVRDQLTERQQQALLGYVRAGGGLLLILPDTAAAGEFAGTALEGMLPVAFGRPPAETLQDMQARAFQQQMRVRSGSGPEAIFANAMAEDPHALPLHSFKIVPQTSLAKIFTAEGAPIRPKFAQHARIQRVKPGAEILAVSNPQGGSVQPLMAVQAFGRGRSTVLVSDMLWRWSLSEPSTAQTARNFWQQLTAWLAQPASGALRFVDAFGEVPVNTPVAMRLETDGVLAPSVATVAPDGTRGELRVERDRDGLWRVAMTPESLGVWTVVAATEDGEEAQARFEVVEGEGMEEHDVRPPKLAELRAIAEATGGQLLASHAPESWKRRSDATSMEIPLSEKRTLLWNQWTILFPLLGLYGAELLLRRQARLL